jgi:hypothetical protein
MDMDTPPVQKMVILPNGIHADKNFLDMAPAQDYIRFKIQIARSIKQRLSLGDITIEHLAAEMGCTVNRINRIIKTDVAVSIAELFKLQYFLGVSLITEDFIRKPY